MRRARREDPSAWDPQWLWAFHGSQPGYRLMIEAAGTIAAPLLAGFSFTLLVLVLPTLPATPRTVSGATAEPFSRFPEPAAAALLVAGLLLVACVQASLSAKYHGLTPSGFAEWHPEHVRPAPPEEPEQRTQLHWDSARLPSIEVAGTWYAGWLRVRQREELAQVLRWARRARYSYHAGILSLLLGVALLVFPPAGTHGFWRWALAVVAIAGVAAEIIWISDVSEIARKRRERRAKAAVAATPAAS